ncbi:MAG: TonB-dependent receptor [Bacteroidales bacterium]|nr:TonB-dependent receptor [Bacteroidales bacterium]
MYKRFLCILASALLSMGGVYAQNVVHGTVKDAGGAPLPGVTVLVSGTLSGTTTDADGNYSLSVAQGATLEYSCLGMTTVTYVCKGAARHDVVMEEDALFLDDVVVVGYGTQKKSSLTAAVSAIKGDEILKAPATDVTQVLAGRLPGISSIQESGEPGLDQASLRIRGSIYGVSYVVDGFPVDNISDLNPADIESVSVLKDGASAAVYGLQAAGGVIIITTRKGEKGQTKLTYNGSFGASVNANFPKFMDGPQFAYYYNVADMMDQMARGQITSAGQYVPYFSESEIAAMTNGDPSDGWDNVNYIDKVFGTGFTQKHSLTIQGGNDAARHFTSIGFTGQNGNIDNFNYKRYNVRSNVEGKFAEHFDYKVGLAGMLGIRNTPAFLSGGSDSDGGTEVGYFSGARPSVQLHPCLPERFHDQYAGAGPPNQSYLACPLAAIYESGSKYTRSADISLNATVAYRAPFLEGLTLKLSGSFDYSTSYNKNLSTPYTLSEKYKSGGEWLWRTSSDNPHVTDNSINLGEGTVFSQQLVGQASIEYQKSFDKHNVDALVLGEAREYKGNGLSAYIKNLPFASLPELSNGVPTNSPVGGWSSASRSAGFVFRAKYDYDEKYLAEFTGRYDGSYKFSGMSNNRWGFFPSVSLGWRPTKEDFMSGASSWLDDLKLRGSFGLLGNDSVSEYMFLSSYSQYNANVAYGLLNGTTAIKPAYYTSGIPNTDLTWEKTQSWNVGFDATLWKGLLGVEFDVFYNYTYDILTVQSSGFPPSMGGYYPTWVNNDAIDSRGVDIMLSHHSNFNVGGKPLYFDVSASLTWSKTRWLRHNDDPNIVNHRKIVGTEYGSILCWQADGLYRSEEEIDNSAWYNTRPNVGDIKYVDLNGDGKIDEDDKGYFGRSNRPKLTYGLNLNLAWNGIDLNAQFTGGALFDMSMTGTYYNGYDDNTIWTRTFKEGGNSPLYLVENAYSEFNPNGTFPRLTLGAPGHGGDNGLSSTFWIRDGAYVRLKTLQLGYTFPESVRKIIKVGVRLFFEGQNLFTISGLPAGIDPESPGVNNGYYPQQRLLMGGITLTL